MSRSRPPSWATRASLRRRMPAVSLTNGCRMYTALTSAQRSLSAHRSARCSSGSSSAARLLSACVPDWACVVCSETSGLLGLHG